MTSGLSSFPHIATALGIAPNAAIADLEARLAEIETPYMNIIFSEEGKEIIKTLESLKDKYSAEIIEVERQLDDWRYAEFGSPAGTIAKALLIPSAGLADKTPPTLGEEMLIRGWAQCPELVNISDNSIRGRILLLWDKSHHDVEPSVFRPNMLSLLGFTQALPKSANSEPWLSSTRFEFTASSRLLQTTSGDRLSELMQLALLERTLRWRFLSLYRILEYDYLRTVFDQIKNNFLTNPKATLDNATTSLKNEFNQLRGLSSAYGLDDFFEEIYSVVKKLKSGNRFANALEKQCEGDSRLKESPGVAAKGLLLTYLARCAIVHAGEGAPIYESFQDAEEVLVSIVPLLEKTIFQYLGVEHS